MSATIAPSATAEYRGRTARSSSASPFGSTATQSTTSPERQPGGVHAFERDAENGGDRDTDPSRPHDPRGATIVTTARPHHGEEHCTADQKRERPEQHGAVDAIDHADRLAPARRRQQRVG